MTLRRIVQLKWTYDSVVWSNYEFILTNLKIVKIRTKLVKIRVVKYIALNHIKWLIAWGVIWRGFRTIRRKLRSCKIIGIIELINWNLGRVKLIRNCFWRGIFWRELIRNCLRRIARGTITISI